MNDPNIPSARVKGIDRIRAFAALSVMLAHTAVHYIPDSLYYAFTGMPAVFVFFVISGFCIHHPYISSPLSLPAFYASRLIRIYPVVFVGVLLAKMSGRPDLAAFSLQGGYILWSVVCELWYYLLYPGFYFLSRYISWRKQWLISFVIYMAMVNIRHGDQFGNLHHLYSWKYLWLVGLPAWLTGCILAQELPGFMSMVSRFSQRWLWRLLIASVASALFWLTLNTPVKNYYTLNIFAILVAFWVTVEIVTAKDELKPNLWDWFGTWSYSIYVFHEVVRGYLEKMGITSSIKIPLILFGCYLAYVIVESPSHKIAKVAFRKLKGLLQIDYAYRKALA